LLLPIRRADNLMLITTSEVSSDVECNCNFCLVHPVQVFINVPWWYLAANKMMSPFLTQRTKSKFVFASPAKSAATLFRFVL
jgi:hypothetical protein